MKYLIGILLLFSLSTSAQYKYAVGIRFDRRPGITFKNNKGTGTSLEAMLHGFGNGAKVTLLAEKHQKAFSTGHWRWYYGAGGHLAAASRYRKWEYAEPLTQVGVDGILGIEHTFSEVPLNISLDWKPEFNFVNYTGLYLDNVGLSLRFAIK